MNLSLFQQNNHQTETTRRNYGSKNRTLMSILNLEFVILYLWHQKSNLSNSKINVPCWKNDGESNNWRRENTHDKTNQTFGLTYWNCKETNRNQPTNEIKKKCSIRFDNNTHTFVLNHVSFGFYLTHEIGKNSIL